MPGLYFEEFSIGQTFKHGITRTITEADNVWFSALTHNPAPLHLDEEYMKGSEFGQRIVNSCLTLSFMVGISVGDTTVGTTLHTLSGYLKGRGRNVLLDEATAEVWPEQAGLRVRISGDSRITDLALARADQKAARVYYGHGYCIEDPGTFRAGGEYHVIGF